MDFKKDFLLSEYWNLCYSAHSNTSFSPERRADMYVKDYSTELEEDLKELGENQGNYKEKYINNFTSWMSAKGRCLSSMITGPANFPVRRAEKANNSERNHYEKFINWREKYFKAVNRVRTPSPEEDLDNALADLDKLVIKQDLMKMVNALVRKNHKKMDKPDLEQLLLVNEIPTEYIKEAMNDSYSGLGFASFSLTNNNAKIKARMKKVNVMRARIENKLSWKDIEFDGGSIKVEDDRVKVYHDEKPDQSTITSLKSRGFRWSRNWGCWCRKHTAQAVEIARTICTPEIVETERKERMEAAKKGREEESKKEDRVGEAMAKLGAFFAFGNAQFDEKKVEGVKYASLGMGIICPLDKVDELAKELGLKLKKTA